MHKVQVYRPHASRRAFLGKVAGAGTVLGTGLLCPRPAHAEGDRDDSPNPIPGGGAPFAPFGVMVHHNGLKPTVPLANLSDPSQITDFNGFVGLTHIRGGGTGIDTATGATTPLAYQADMGFGKGEYIGSDGYSHRGTFAFV